MNKQTKQLMKENNDLSFHLKAADNKILTDMVVYIRGADISGYQQELVRRDITQMILDGEQRGDTMEDIIGSDYKIFCDNVLRGSTSHPCGKSCLLFRNVMCRLSSPACSPPSFRSVRHVWRHPHLALYPRNHRCYHKYGHTFMLRPPSV